ncbi:unnamed protein product, partial [Rotaria sordida]
MIPTSDLKNRHISILHDWNKCIRSARVVHGETNIPR